ncbi:3-oxoacyl-ACP reductase FabG [Undibacterium sp.]|uniref:3-oxoacyl-ACP reductase FabG n=1 Tax=Undibacterium sp. TaxID=1914977 RepID=UPI003752C8DB
MTQQLANQVALVTGASRGIGKAIAIALAQAGAKVIGTATSESGAQAITTYLQEVNPEAGRGVAFNVNDVERCGSLVDEIQKEFGSLSILVNNAGITQDQLAMRMKEDDWDSVISTNLNSVARLSRAVLRGMMKAKHGRIINITSVVGSSGNPGQMNYAAAKAGVAGMSRALALEIGSRNITVNCIAPGFIDTDMTKSLTDDQKTAILSQIPMGKLGQPEDIAAATVFLASPQAGYVTGTTIHVNGGMYLC